MKFGFRQIHDALQSAAQQSPMPSRLPDLAPERYRALRDAPHLRDLLAELRADAIAAHAAPMPELPFSLFQLFDSAGTRIEYERPYFARRRRVPPPSLPRSAACAGGRGVGRPVWRN